MLQGMRTLLLHRHPEVKGGRRYYLRHCINPPSRLRKHVGPEQVLPAGAVWLHTPPATEVRCPQALIQFRRLQSALIPAAGFAEIAWQIGLEPLGTVPTTRYGPRCGCLHSLRAPARQAGARMHGHSEAASAGITTSSSAGSCAPRLCSRSIENCGCRPSRWLLDLRSPSVARSEAASPWAILWTR